MSFKRVRAKSRSEAKGRSLSSHTVKPPRKLSTKNGTPHKKIAKYFPGIKKRQVPISKITASPIFPYSDKISTDDPFAAIRRNTNTSLDNQQAALRLLNATEASIHASGMSFLPVAYFDALFPLLDDEDREFKNGVKMSTSQINELNTSVAYLLSFIVDRLPHDFIVDRYPAIFSKFPKALKRFISNAPLVRSLIPLVSKVVIVFVGSYPQLVRDRPTLRQLIGQLHFLAVDARPKVRKAAQESLIRIISLINDHSNSESKKNLSDDDLEELSAIGQLRVDLIHFIASILDASTRKNWDEAQHIIGLIRNPIISSTNSDFCSDEMVLTILKKMLRVATLGANYLTTQVYRTIPLVCGASNAEKIFSVVFNQKPEVNLEEIVIAWLGLYLHIICSSRTIDSNFLQVNHIKAVSEYLFSIHKSVHTAVENTFKNLFITAVNSDVELCVCEIIERWLRIKGAMQAPSAIKIAGFLANVCTVETSIKLMDLLADAHDGRQGRHASLIEAILGPIVARFGPELVLSAIPLNLFEENNSDKKMVPRPWVLAVIRDHTVSGSLEFYKKTLLPMANRLEQSAKGPNEKVFELIAHQIYLCMPPFILSAQDFCTEFPELAPIIGSLITGNIQLRPSMCNMLANIVSKCRVDESMMRIFTETAAAPLVSILFNVFSVTIPGERVPVVKAIESVVSCLAVSEVENYLAKIVSKTRVILNSKTEGDENTASSLLELAGAVSSAVESPQIALKIVEFCTEILQIEDVAISIEKRVYKLIDQLLTKSSMIEHLDIIETCLLNHASSSAAKRSRFQLLIRIVAGLPDVSLHWVPLIIPEAVFGVKEMNMRTRALAFELLLVMMRRMLRGGVIRASKTNGMLSADTNATLGEFLTMLMAGLAGRTPHMISASIMAIARIVYELSPLLNLDSKNFKDDLMHTTSSVSSSDENSKIEGDSLPEEQLEEFSKVINCLLTDVVSLLKISKSREICKSALGFVKVAVISLPSSMINGITTPFRSVQEDGIKTDDTKDSSGHQHLGCIIEAILGWSGEHQMHFKERVKHMMSRLVRRFGFNAVWDLTPVEHRPLLTAIKRQKERSQRLKAAKRDVKVNDDDYKAGDNDLSSLLAKATSNGSGIADSFSSFKKAMADDSDAEDDFEDDGEDSVLKNIADIDDENEIERLLAKRLNLKSSLKRRATDSDVEMIDDSEDEIAFDGEGRLVIKSPAGIKKDDAIDDGEDRESDDEDSRQITLDQPSEKRKRFGDVRKSTDRFEPYAYVPMQRASKKSNKASATGKSTKNPKYFMGRK